ncbi:MAG: CDP-alcohol phosphatidyltransferase family protein [Candidatus Binatia bacterium]
MRALSAHLLSLSRIVFGVLVLRELVAMDRAAGSWIVLPLVIAAAAADFSDGRLARRLDVQSDAGRLLDNLCDATFLVLVFSGFAITHTWSRPVLGSAIRYWEHANWLPVIALVVSFGSYMVRWGLSAWLGQYPRASSRGHFAGVANYVLAVIGGVAVLPWMNLSPWLLEPTFVTVALLNVSGAGENLGLTVEMLLSRRR